MDISIFMFKVGEYYESEIKAVSSYLKDAGFKVEIKGLVTARMDHTATRQGRLSELKERLAGFELYERSMAAIKAVAENADSRESFIDLMLTELDPNWKTVKDHVVTECEEGGEIDEDARVANIRSVAEYALAIDFANTLLDLNSINPGEPINGRLDDPVGRPLFPVDGYLTTS